MQLNSLSGSECFLCGCRDWGSQSSKILPEKLLAVGNYAQITCLRILILKLVICQSVGNSFYLKHSVWDTKMCSKDSD